MQSNLFTIENKVKKKLQNGEVSIGAFLLTGSSFVAEAMSISPLEWLVIDMEASHASKEDVLHILQAMNAYDITPIVRVAERNKHLIESVLDFGAKGVLVPKVDTAKQAEEMAKAANYPPEGNRGINAIRASGYYSNAKDYLFNANEATITAVQIESKESVEQVEQIAQTAHVDILFIGLGDLAASYGQLDSVFGKEMNSARQKVLEACKKFNKIPGIFAHNIDVAHFYIKEGFKFIAIGNDIKFMNSGLNNCLEKIKQK